MLSDPLSELLLLPSQRCQLSDGFSQTNFPIAGTFSYQLRQFFYTVHEFQIGQLLVMRTKRDALYRPYTHSTTTYREEGGKKQGCTPVNRVCGPPKSL